MNPETLESLTPAMQQYYDIKKNHQDAILFFRMGDFYEMFESDAQIAHKVLGITLTSRNKNAHNPILLAGIPYHAKEKYLPLLIKAGYKVAIAEQISDPKLKGIVQREVVRVVTPATLSLENEGYDTQESSSLLVAIIQSNECYGFSSLNLSNHIFECCEFWSFEELSTELYTSSPSEVLLERHQLWDQKIHEILTKKYGLKIFYTHLEENPYTLLTQKFWVKNLEGFWLEDKILAQKASALLLQYLTTQQKTDFSCIKNLSYKTKSEYMQLDEATIRSLDLVYNLAAQSSREGTLFWALNETKTSMGKRFLRQQILHPLQDIGEIQKRQRYIEILKTDTILLEKIRKQLWFVADLDAIITRLSLWRMTPRDMLALKRSLIAVQEVISLVQGSENEELKKILK